MSKYIIGLQLMILGMGTVFLALYSLSLVLWIGGKLFGPSKKAKTISQDYIKKEINDSEIESESEKIAAITAAINSMMENEKNYRIISIRKKPNSDWKS